MARDRQRAREARQAQRRREVQEAARRRQRQARRTAWRQRLRPTVPHRRRRYGALSTRAVSQLVVVFLAVQALGWLLLAGWGQRLALAVLTLACLLVLVRTRRSPTR